jgi:hypothetical protein
MDPDSGRVFGPLPIEGEPGQLFVGPEAAEKLRQAGLDPNPPDGMQAEIERAIAHLEGGGRLTQIGEGAVQRLRLGDRELRRRRRRRDR